MTDTVTIRRELLRVIEQTWRIQYKGAPAHSESAADAIEQGLAELRAALATPVQGEAVPAAFFKRDSPIKGHTEFMPYEPWMDDGLSGGWVPLYTAPPQPAIAAARKGE